MAAFDYLKQYATFDSVEEMDQHVEQHIKAHFYKLTEAERAIVFKLASRSLEHTGASHLKAATIAESLEISTKTVYRAVKKLVELKIIDKVAGKKLNGIKGASIYKILPYSVLSSVSQRTKCQKSCESKREADKIEKQPFNSFKQSIKENNTYATQVVDDVNNNVDNLLKTKEQTPYQKLKSFLGNFLQDKALAYKMYGIWLAQTSKCINKPDFAVAIEAVKYTMRAYKTRKLKSVTGYFNNTLIKLIDKWYEDQLRGMREEYTDDSVEFIW